MKLSLLISGITDSQLEYELVHCLVETKMIPMLHTQFLEYHVRLRIPIM